VREKWSKNLPKADHLLRQQVKGGKDYQNKRKRRGMNGGRMNNKSMRRTEGDRLRYKAEREAGISFY